MCYVIVVMQLLRIQCWLCSYTRCENQILMKIYAKNFHFALSNKPNPQEYFPGKFLASDFHKKLPEKISCGFSPSKIVSCKLIHQNLIFYHNFSYDQLSIRIFLLLMEIYSFFTKMPTERLQFFYSVSDEDKRWSFGNGGH